MSTCDTVKYIFSLPFEKKIWLIVFTVGSLVAWVAIRLLSMHRLSKVMGYHIENRAVCMLATDFQVKKAIEMGKLMRRVSNNVPWACKCLSEALCVKWLLTRYKIPSVFYLGAKLGNGMQAHAWVEVGQRIAIGAPQHREYKVVATFITLNPARPLKQV